MLPAVVPLLPVMRQLAPLVRVMEILTVPEAPDRVMVMEPVREVRSLTVRGEINQVVVLSRRPIHSRACTAQQYGYPPRVFLILGGFFLS